MIWFHWHHLFNIIKFVNWSHKAVDSKNSENIVSSLVFVYMQILNWKLYFILDFFIFLFWHWSMLVARAEKENKNVIGFDFLCKKIVGWYVFSKVLLILISISLLLISLSLSHSSLYFFLSYSPSLFLSIQ